MMLTYIRYLYFFCELFKVILYALCIVYIRKLTYMTFIPNIYRNYSKYLNHSLKLFQCLLINLKKLDSKNIHILQASPKHIYSGSAGYT